MILYKLITVLLFGVIQGLHICSENVDCQQNCIKCGLIFRKGSDCVSNFNDCGDCLEGYEEISVTANSEIKKPCRPLKKKGRIKQCIRNNNCPPNNYCSEGLCITCFECALRNRLNPVEKCAKGPDECGPCLKRYIEDTTATDISGKMCVFVPTNTTCDDHYVNIGTIVVVVVILAIVHTVFFLAKIKCAFLRDLVSRKRVTVSTPPLQVVEKKSNETESTCTELVQQEMQQTNNEQPTAPYYYNGGGDNGRSVNKFDSVDSENTHPQSVQSDSEQREETRSPPTAVCGGCVRVLKASFPEFNSVVTDMDSQDEKLIEGASELAENTTELDETRV